MKYIGLGSLLSALIGVALFFLGSPLIFAAAKFTSNAFMNILKFISLPVIFFSLSATIARLQSQKMAGNLLFRTLGWTFLPR